MEEHLQVWPYIFYMLLSRQLQDAHQNREHPRWHAGDIRYVLVKRLMGDAVAFHLKVAKQCRRLLRHTEQLGHRSDILYEDGAKVADQGVRKIIVGRMTASKDKALSVEDTTLGVVTEIECYAVLRPLIMDMVQSCLCDRDELALVVSGAGALGVPFHQSRPKDILLARRIRSISPLSVS